MYSYDVLNQLNSEIIYTNSTGIGTKATYTYDKAGNIVNKSHSVYNNGTVSNSTTTGCTYDEYWRGLLTGYDGEGITYDAIGNPLSYYNGRRLASVAVDGKTNTYTYNTEGSVCL